MKKVLFILSIVIITSTGISQNSKDECVSCKDNEVDFKKYASAIGTGNISSADQSFAGGSRSTASGNLSFAFGYQAVAGGISSLAFGYQAQATGMYSVAIGRGSVATGDAAFAIGYKNTAQATSSYVFGENLKSVAGGTVTLGMGAGAGENNLKNNIAYSLMVGFNSDVPTFFIGESNGLGTTGKIGIGNITEPQAKLHILGDAGLFNENDASLFIQSSGNYFSTIWLGDTEHSIIAKPGSDITFKTGTNNNFVFENGNIIQTTGFYIASSQIKAPDANGLNLTGQNGNGIFIEDGGNVGIGTTNPVAQIELADFGTAGSMNLKIGNDVYLSDVDQANTLGIYGYQDNTTGAIKLGSNGPKLYGINGNLGIGTTETTGYKLTVAGKILATELKIVENVPSSDYVFYDDYDLRSLSEVESYIGKHNHLPDVPSADEFKENGYNVGEMDDLLLRKIEELTLYLIEQQKIINKQQKDIGLLKKLIEKK
ncbi:MAG: hypothetical protein H8D45_15710 [Bacteroidetes bacterium]|nr:hypothetical protein [Bacteroidota bacterium]MBL7105313.1 hypothetical protein [Bacteroidales bacterium]